MNDQREPFDVVGMPITVYRHDPEKTAIAEWHELGGARNLAGEWFLWERHGWWDNENKKAHFGVPILSEPHKGERDLLAAIEARIKNLEKDGWSYKYTTTFDPNTGQFVPMRI